MTAETHATPPGSVHKHPLSARQTHSSQHQPDAALGQASRKPEAADFSTLHTISYCLVIKNPFNQNCEDFAIPRARHIKDTLQQQEG